MAVLPFDGARGILFRYCLTFCFFGWMMHRFVMSFLCNYGGDSVMFKELILDIH